MDALTLAEYRSKPKRRAVAANRKDEEHQHQAALFEWAQKAAAKVAELAMLVAIPNGGLRNVVVAKKLKAEGVKPGYPDVALDVARAGYHGLRIEMKAGKNKTSEHQKWWLAALAAQGYYCAVCYSWEDAKNKIMAYLAGIPA